MRRLGRFVLIGITGLLALVLALVLYAQMRWDRTFAAPPSALDRALGEAAGRAAVAALARGESTFVGLTVDGAVAPAGPAPPAAAVSFNPGETP